MLCGLPGASNWSREMFWESPLLESISIFFFFFGAINPCTPTVDQGPARALYHLWHQLPEYLWRRVLNQYMFVLAYVSIYVRVQWVPVCLCYQLNRIVSYSRSKKNKIKLNVRKQVLPSPFLFIYEDK